MVSRGVEIRSGFRWNPWSGQTHGFPWVIGVAVVLSQFVVAAELVAQNRVMLGVRFQGDSSVVSMLVSEGPAELAGMQVGDEILSIEKQFILQPADVLSSLRGKRPGNEVQVEVRRGDEFVFLDLKLVRATRGDHVSGKVDPNKLEDPELGILQQTAPEWTVSKWAGLPDGQTDLSLAELSGKTVYMLFFQTSCQASQRQAIPLLAKVVKHFEGDSDVVIVAIQTAFESFEQNTLENAQKVFAGRKLQIPIGQDGDVNQESKTAMAYKSGGTPWTVVVDPNGRVIYNGFHLRSVQAIELIDKARKTPAESVSSK